MLMPGVLTRIARAIRNQPPAEPAERRDAGGFSVGMGIGFAGFSAPGGTFMSAVMAENVATIMASRSVDLRLHRITPGVRL